MEDLEQERKQKRREALEEYQKIISYEITPGTAEPVRNRKPSRRFRIRFRHIFFGAAVIVTAFCYFLSAISCGLQMKGTRPCKRN